MEIKYECKEYKFVLLCNACKGKERQKEKRMKEREREKMKKRLKEAQKRITATHGALGADLGIEDLAFSTPLLHEISAFTEQRKHCPINNLLAQDGVQCRIALDFKINFTSHEIFRTIEFSRQTKLHEIPSKRLFIVFKSTCYS